MSKTVKIPNTANPWRCVINGVEYAYAPGTTQSVPDEVAALIAQIEEYPPDPLPVEKPWPCDPVDLSAYEKKADAFAPTITSPSNGDVIKYDSSTGKWVNGEASGGGATVIGADIDTGTHTITLTMKAGALYAAAQTGLVILSTEEDGDMVISPMRSCLFAEESDYYRFNFELSGQNTAFTCSGADLYPQSILIMGDGQS